jgi:beta-glucosidase
VLEAYQMWSKEFGEDSARQRFEQSARRLLLNVFRVGLFENPYLDPAESKEIVGNAEFMKEGYEAQLKSVVMLKNHANQVLPVKDKKKVYVPKRHFPAIPGMWGGISEEKTEEPIDLTLVKKYFDVVEQPDQADFALCLIQEPSTGWGYSTDDVKKGGNGYVPVSLQYEDYTAVDARPVSIAGGDPMEKTTNRSFKGKTVKTYNRDDMVMVAETKKAMGDKPVVVVVEIGRPIVLSEIEPSADAILISFNVQHQVLLDIISGKSEPSALLPMQLPADMKAVEEQQEDVPRDMRCYQDVDGNTYELLKFEGIGLNERVKRVVQGYAYILPVDYSFVVNYQHDNGFTEVQSVHFNLRYRQGGKQFETNGLMFNAGLKTVKGTSKVEFEDNLIKKIKELGYNRQLWDDIEIVKRTPMEEEAIELMGREDLFGVY